MAVNASQGYRPTLPHASARPMEAYFNINILLKDKYYRKLARIHLLQNYARLFSVFIDS
jgi:hypothetical protein